MVRGDNVDLADGAKEEAGGKDDAGINEWEEDYGYERKIGESFDGSNVGFWREWDPTLQSSHESFQGPIPGQRQAVLD